MSLQQITLDQKGSQGIKKEINKNSIDIVFDILQVYAYSMPIESTVRELTSNAVDSQREKEIAIQILTGKAKEEDFFIIKHGKEFEDSRFNPKYYDLNWLNTTKNEVELEYVEHQGSGFCDEFIVRDYGVGLGNGRLEGSLSLGFSTKRTTREQIGGFGIGQKAALSTMTPFYTMESHYNGQYYKLNIYSKKIDDLIGPFNLDTGEENQFITLSSGAKLYYEKTDQKNCTEIIVPVKKLNKHKYIDAVKSQLLFLPNVRFFITKENGYRYEESFKASVIYNSENLIISNNSRYSRPHLVVVKDKTSNIGICYNEIQYKELELEQRYGQVGLKVQMRAVGKDENGEEYLINEGIAVTPNREQVIWNDDTKNYLLKITKNVTEEAIDIVNKQLVEKDFLKWIQKATTVMNNLSRGSALSELSQMIDKANIIPTYTLDKEIRLKSPEDMFWGMFVRNVRYFNSYSSSKGSYIKKVQRDFVNYWANFSGFPVYVKLSDSAASNVKDQYILQMKCQGDPFIMLELKDLDKMLDELLEKTPDDKKADVEEKFNKKRARMMKILDYIQKSENCFDYDALEVPEEFKVAAEEQEALIQEVEKKDNASLEELRKANGEIVFFSVRNDDDYRISSSLTWDKIEEKTSIISTWTGKVYYGFNEDADMLKCACRLLGRNRNNWYNDNIRIVKIAQKNEKHFRTIGKHISDFFYQLDNNVIKMDEEVKEYYTARFVCKKVTENKDLNFFSGYDKIDDRLYKLYQYLVTYSERFSEVLKIRKADGTSTEMQLFEQLQKYGDFQKFVEDNKDDDKAIVEKSKELFGTDLVKNAEILDPKVIQQCELLIEYAEPVKGLFNNISALNERDYTYQQNKDRLTKDGVNLIRVLLQHLGLDNFEIPEELMPEKVAQSK